MMKHGHKRRGRVSSTYSSWQNMVQRCTDPRAEEYPRYGGAGVTVHARWQTFEGFLADMGERPPGTSLDRVDGTRGYEPGNCRWATPTEQSRNRRSNVRLTYQGKTLCVVEWAELLGVPQDRIRNRIRYGWPVERILSNPGDCRCTNC
jgi:hypothetical protein